MKLFNRLQTILIIIIFQRIAKPIDTNSIPFITRLTADINPNVFFTLRTDATHNNRSIFSSLNNV